MKLKNIICFIVICLFISDIAFSQVKVACVGNSITYGAGIENREVNSYPAQLQKILGYDWNVKNFGRNGATLLKNGDIPYWVQSEFANAQNFNPDVVIIMLGTNDTKPQNIKYKDDFVKDYISLIDTFRTLPSHPYVFICLPVPVFPYNYTITDSVLTKEILPRVKEVANKSQTEIIDLNKLMANKADLFPDKVHPNAQGAGMMANEIAVYLERWRANREEQKDADHYTIADSIKRIVFIGNSITYMGNYITDIDAYFTLRYPNKKYEIINVGLPSENVSGLTEPHHAGDRFPRPDLHERLTRVLDKVKPDLVFATYGMNDGIYLPFNKDRFQKYKDGIRWMHDEVTKRGIPIIHITPSIYDERKGKTYANVLDIYADWLISCQYTYNWNVIDTHWPMRKDLEDRRVSDTSFEYAKDGIHPNEIGHFLMAKEILKYVGENEIDKYESIKSFVEQYENGDSIFSLIDQRQIMMKDAWLTDTKHTRPEMNVGLPMPKAMQKSEEIEKKIQELQKDRYVDKTFSEYTAKEFDFEGHTAKIIFPHKSNENKDWVWRARFWGHEPQVDKALLEKGYHLVFVDVANLYGNNEAVKLWNKFYDYCTSTYHLNKKVVLEGMSRGGLIIFNWAAENTDKVKCIYADAPVCDIKSWPGGLYSGEGSPNDWKQCLSVYNLDTVSVLKFKGIPLFKCKNIAKAKIPVLIVYGDADKVVPCKENAELLASKMKKWGGLFQLIKKEGIGHHPHCLKDPTLIVNFLSGEGVEYGKCINVDGY